MTKAVFVADVRSLYFGVRNAFPGHAINYLDVMKRLEAEGFNFAFKYAFGKYEPDKSYRFATLLRETGYEIFFDRKFYDAELALKVAGCLQHVDAVVLASCWYGHYPVLEYAKSQGKQTTLLTLSPPQFVKYYCTKIMTIDQSLLRKRTDDADVPTQEEDSRK